MHITLNEILKHGPCGIHSGGASGFSKLLKNLNKTEADDEPLHIMDILKSNGIKDAIWSLICFDYLDSCLFLSDLAEFVVPIFENEYPDGFRPRDVIQAIIDYKLGLISRDQLIAYVHEIDRSANADRPVFAAEAYNADRAVAHAVFAAVIAVVFGAIHAANDTAFRIKTEELFIKHFGGAHENH